MTGSHEVKSSNLSVSTKTRLLATVFFCITKKALQAKCFFHRFYTCEHSEPADRCLLTAGCRLLHKKAYGNEQLPYIVQHQIGWAHPRLFVV